MKLDCLVSPGRAPETDYVCILSDRFHLIVHSYHSSQHLDTTVKLLVFLVHRQVRGLNCRQESKAVMIFLVC
jgi:hypothetical protein